MLAELASHRDAIALIAEYFEQLSDAPPLPIEYGGHPDDEKIQELILPEDHPFVKIVMEMVTTPQVGEVLERLSERFLAEGRFVKPTEVRVAVLNTGTHKDSAYVRFGKDRISRSIYLTIGSLYYIHSILKESLGGKKLKKGHIIGILLHEFFHPLKFEGHPEEYNADRASIIAMIELGYDPQDRIEVMQAYDLMSQSRGPGFQTSHPFSHSRIAYMLSTIDDVYAAHPHLLEHVLHDDELPADVLESIFENNEVLHEQAEKKRLFALNSEQLRERLMSAETFAQFWECYLAYDLRQNTERCLQYADESPGAYHLSKLVLMSRSLRIYTKYQEKKQEYERAGQPIPDEMFAELMDPRNGKQLNGNAAKDWDVSYAEDLVQENDGALFQGIVEYVTGEPTGTAPTLPEVPLYKELQYRLCFLSDMVRALYGKYVNFDEYQEEPHPDRAKILEPLSQWLKTIYKTRWANAAEARTHFTRPTKELDYNLVDSFSDSPLGPVSLSEYQEFEQLLYQICILTVEQIAAEYDPQSEQAAMYRDFASELRKLAEEAETGKIYQDLLPEALYDWSLLDLGGPVGQELERSAFAQQRNYGYGKSIFTPTKRALQPETHAQAHRALGMVLGALHTEKFASLREFSAKGAELLAELPELKGLSQRVLSAWLESIAADDYSVLERIVAEEVKADPTYAQTLIAVLQKNKDLDVMPSALHTGDENFLPEQAAVWLRYRMQYSGQSFIRYSDQKLDNAFSYFVGACLDGYLRAVLPEGVLEFEEDGSIAENQSIRRIRVSATARQMLMPIRDVFKGSSHWQYLYGALEEITHADTDRFNDLYAQLSAGDIDHPDQNVVRELQHVCKALKITFTHQAEIRPTIKQFGVLIRAGVLAIGEEARNDIEISHLMESRAAIKQYDNRSGQMKRLALDVLKAAHRKHLEACADDDEKHFRSYLAAKDYQQKFWWFASYLSTEYRMVPSSASFKKHEREDVHLPLDEFYAFVLKHKLPVPATKWMRDGYAFSSMVTSADATDAFVAQAEAKNLILPVEEDLMSGSNRSLSPVPMRTQDVLAIFATAQRLGWREDTDNPRKLNGTLREVITQWHSHHNSRFFFFYLITGGTPQEIREHYAPLHEELDFRSYSDTEAYLKDHHLFLERQWVLRKTLPVELQEKIIERYGGLQRGEDVLQMVEVVRQNFPYPGPFQDELIAYCWSLYEASSDGRKKRERNAVSDALFQKMSKTGWETIARNSTKIDIYTSSSNAKDWTKSYYRHTVGKKFFADEIFANVGTRRFAYETAIEYPFMITDSDYDDGSRVKFANMTASFVESFVAQRLLVVDRQLETLLETDFRAAIEMVRETAGQMRIAVVDVYIEYFIRHTLQRSDLTIDDTRYLYEQYGEMLPDSAKRSGLAAPLLRKRIDADAHFFEDTQRALADILMYLPEGGYERNEFLHELQTHAQVTVDDVRAIESHIVDVTGIRKDTAEERRTVTIFDSVGDLAADQKGQLLFYLIDENSPKPTGQIFSEYEARTNGRLVDARYAFLGASVTEREQIVQRLVYGPDAALSLPHVADGDSQHPSVTSEMSHVREAFSLELAAIFVPEDPAYPPEKVRNYRDLFSAALVSMEPLKASRVISNIINKMIELDRQGQKLAVEDMLFIAVLSFGSVGIKSSQLVADYPWVPPELRQVFKQGMWNAEIIRPAEILKVFDYEQAHLGNFPGMRIARFIKPLGSAGICQAYLVEVERDQPDGSTTRSRMVVKAVKPGVIGMKQVARDVRDLQRFLSELQRRGYELDIPADFTDIITTIILEERKKANEAAYFEKYQATNELRSIQFDTPEVYAVGQFMIFVELIEGEVLADTTPEDFEIMQVLLGAFQDLQIGVLNLDDHVGNFIRLEPGQEHQLSSIDGGFTIDLRSTPDLHSVVQQLVLGLLSGDGVRTRGAMYALGLDGDVPDAFQGDMSEKIETFRKIFFRAPKNEHTVLLHKVLWWMYRKLSLYHSASPFMQQMISSNFS